jgi:hypothetical protein
VRKIAEGWLYLTGIPVVWRSAATASESIVEGFLQGRSVLKRLLLSLVAAVAIVLAFGAANALACQALQFDKTEARAGETVNFTLSDCQFDDNWELAVFFEMPGSQDPSPEQRVLVAGFAADTTVTGDFALPDEIGDNEQDVTVKLLVVRNGQQLDSPLELQMRYLGKATTGGTGSTGATDDGSTDFSDADLGNLELTPLPKRITRTQQRKKNRAKPKAKTKSKAPTKKQSKQKVKHFAPVTPIKEAPTVTPPATPATPAAGGGLRPSTLPKPGATPPPGVGGSPGSSGIVPGGGTPIAPGSPSTGSLGTPAAATGHDNALGVPVWLVVLLGLMTLLGLGGAQTRMLGFWGPLPLVNPDARDARLLALQRASQSGAADQKRIAALKRLAKDRERVG